MALAAQGQAIVIRRKEAVILNASSHDRIESTILHNVVFPIADNEGYGKYCDKDGQAA